MEFLKISLFHQKSCCLLKFVFLWPCACTTCHSPSDLPGCFLSHFQWCLFAVPGSVWCANQIGGIFERTLTETDKYTSSTMTLSCSKMVLCTTKGFCFVFIDDLCCGTNVIEYHDIKHKISKHSCKLPLIIHGSEVKYSTMILVHKIWNHRADLSAANPWCTSPVLSHL